MLDSPRVTKLIVFALEMWAIIREYFPRNTRETECFLCLLNDSVCGSVCELVHNGVSAEVICYDEEVTSFNFKKVGAQFYPRSRWFLLAYCWLFRLLTLELLARLAAGTHIFNILVDSWPENMFFCEQSGLLNALVAIVKLSKDVLL